MSYGIFQSKKKKKKRNSPGNVQTRHFLTEETIFPVFHTHRQHRSGAQPHVFVSMGSARAGVQKAVERLQHSAAPSSVQRRRMGHCVSCTASVPTSHQRFCMLH